MLVNVTEFRRELPHYLQAVDTGEQIKITVHGKVVARLVKEEQIKTEAKRRLQKLRKTSKIHDIISPIGEDWDANR